MSTKIHLGVGEAGVVSGHLSPGQSPDCKQVERLWQNWPWQTIQAVVGDKGYWSAAIREALRGKGVLPVIPYKGLWLPADKPFTSFDNPFAKSLYAKRNFIERLFAKIKENKNVLVPS